MSKTRTVYAPAKINLCLHVLGRRPDGYHDLAMLMQRVALYDRLDVILTDEPGVRVDCPGLQLAKGESNIVERAARLLMEHVGLEQGVAITMEKRIPAAAGLGGGSSDAAAVLTALDSMLGLDLPRAELMALGARLGADVPFFIFGQTAWATGIGDRLEPWPGLPPVWFVLVNPRIAVSTAWVYENLGLTRPGAAARIPGFPEGASGLVPLLHNDLEAVTCRRYTVVDEIKTVLLRAGAIGALMSGSGPTVFGLFADPTQAKAVAADITNEHGWWAAAVDPL